MDLHAQYQQQQQQQQQEHHHIYAPPQPYDQSTQSYYDAYNQPQQYAYSNYTQYYNNPNYQPQQLQSQTEPTSIHPPGVPIPPESAHLVAPEQTHHQNQLNSYYPQQQQQQQVAPYAGNVDSSQQWQGGYGAFGAAPLQGGPQIVQSSYSGAGSRPYGGASRGHFGPRSHGSGPFRGRGRGRGRGRSRNATTNSVSSVAGAEGDAHASGYKQPTFPAPVWPPASIAWCELCRVDCNTPEILEQHKNGKKHKKNLKVQEELQKLNKILVRGPNKQMHNSELKPQADDQTGKVEASEEKKLPEVSLSTQSVTNENKVENEQQKESEQTEQTEETTRKSRMDNFGAQGHGFKRKMRGGQGGKWMRTHEGSRRPVEPPKPKEIIPLICELCNAKCESPIVFDSHLKGKKHLANLKRFQGQQEAALQALYPAIQALYPTLQALCQLNSNASASFAPQFLQQGFNGPQTFIEPGSSVFSQGQSSASGPPAASALPSILDQKTSMLQGSTSALTESQNEPLQFERKEADDVAGDSSVVALQNTLTGTDQFPLGTKIDEAVSIPAGETAPSDQVALPVTESKME